jgi:hypothetical protein
MPPAHRAALLASALIAVAACGSSQAHGPTTSSTQGTGGTSAPGGAGGTAGAAGGAPTACAAATTRACACAGGTGVERCAADGSGLSACECAAYGQEIAVSPGGDDAAAGTLAAPFRTLDRAREAVRALAAAGLPDGGVVVWLREGVYPLVETFTLGAADAGLAGKPVAYRGYPGEHARLVGGVALDPQAFVPVDPSSPVYARLDPAVRDAVREISLPAHGVTDVGALVQRGFCGAAAQGPLELFVDGVPMTLARWPDAAANDAPPTSLEAADALDVYGGPTPDVTGHYVKDGVQDGQSSFSRVGAVNGLQYHLYRSTWDYQSNTYTAWFLTTGTTGYPGDTDPWWNRYDPKLGKMDPAAAAQGSVVFQSPTAVNHGFASIAEAVSDTVFRYSGDRPTRWAKPAEAWFHGFWKYAWADCHVKPESVDPATSTVTFASPPGYGITAGQPYYAYDLPEEITVPGEYWIDRDTGSLYLLPPAGLASAEVLVSVLDTPLVTLDQTSYVELRDLTLEAGRADLVRIQGGARDQLVGLTLRNAGTDAGSVDGQDHVVRACHVHDTGNGGLRIGGGDRPSLTPGGNTVEQSHFHDLSRWEWTYRPAVSLDGDGQVVRHNLVHHLPHSAFLYGGSEHLIELNVIHDVLRFSSDAGAIYAGRDWGARGNVVQHNFIHHIATFFEGYGAHGIYLDDCLSGVRVEGNVLYQISGYGIEHGGGRDDLLLNNVVARCGAALSADSRAKEWGASGPNNTPGDSWNLLEKLEKVGYQLDPWASKYPACAAIPDSYATLEDPSTKWLLPEGCRFSRNVGSGNATWITATPGTMEAYAEVTDNLQDVDLQFVDEAALDLSFQPTSPALAVPGFQPIPFHEMGIQP